MAEVCDYDEIADMAVISMQSSVFSYAMYTNTIQHLHRFQHASCVVATKAGTATTPNRMANVHLVFAGLGEIWVAWPGSQLISARLIESILN